MPAHAQPHSCTVLSGARSWMVLGARGLRLRLTQELSVGFAALGRGTAGKLLHTSPVNH
jgi:hypothetical protein